MKPFLYVLLGVALTCMILAFRSGPREVLQTVGQRWPNHREDPSSVSGAATAQPQEQKEMTAQTGEEGLLPSGLFCLKSRRAGVDAQIPILRNVKVEISSRWMRGVKDEMDESDRPEGPSQRRDRHVRIHICGKHASKIAQEMGDCNPFWDNYLKPPRSNDDLNQRHVLAATTLVLHPDTAAPCHYVSFPNAEGGEGRHNSSSVQIEDDVWLSARYSMDNQFHGLLDQGLLQTWETWNDASSAAKDARQSFSTSASTEERDSKLLLMHQYSLTGRRLPFLSVRDAGFEGYKAYHDLWPVVLPVNVRLVPQGVQLRLYAKRLLLSHYSFSSGVGWGGQFLNTREGFKSAGRDFGNALQTEMTKTFGRTRPAELNPKSLPILFDGRNLREFDGGMHRARGVQPALKEEIFRAFVPDLASGHITVSFDHTMTLEQQWRLLQAHQIVVAGEGAFFAWLLLAAPGSTWVMVHNHTHPPFDNTRSSNYHTPTALFSNWTRLVVYVIDNGIRESADELARVLRETPWKGGDVIHVGALPDSTSKNKHLWLKDVWEKPADSSVTLDCLAEKRVPVVLNNYYDRHFDAFNEAQPPARRGTPFVITKVRDILLSLGKDGEASGKWDAEDFALIVHNDTTRIKASISAEDLVLGRLGSQPTVTLTRVSQLFSLSNQEKANEERKWKPMVLRMVKDYPKVLVCDLQTKQFMRSLDIRDYKIDLASVPQLLEKWEIRMAESRLGERRQLNC
jgi:hypothetical protein